METFFKLSTAHIIFMTSPPSTEFIFLSVQPLAALEKHEVIQDLFGDEQVERILSIPLVYSVHTDEAIWMRDNTGAHTTKSGYKWLITKGQSLLGVCKVEEESLAHLFWECAFTTQVLLEIGVVFLTTDREQNWKQWLAVGPKYASLEPPDGETVKVNFDASFQQQ
ncbi:hypothetical protein GOBAR_AA22863 [Gossypium barbadense]|uniref:Reverse transcriptase zinc-binding domain-containing protein n=1 Tax=Gossypium barbadense TaxID=3634 RepID=A0A2P5X382_GOSBA|nr:hypothetical protein GOBAR_AA22863 [Gossypium barbadense]